ncbi:hypothetical protein KBD34_03685 [Patescibacteria group bacterium]|nr:hypothetical protein [Patescibacteria group bacterium]
MAPPRLATLVVTAASCQARGLVYRPASLGVRAACIASAPSSLDVCSIPGLTRGNLNCLAREVASLLPTPATTVVAAQQPVPTLPRTVVAAAPAVVRRRVPARVLPATPGRCQARGLSYRPPASPGAAPTCILATVAANTASETSRSAVIAVATVTDSVRVLTGDVRALERRFTNFASVSSALTREAAACEAHEFNPAHRINPAYNCATIARRLQDAQRSATGQPSAATATDEAPAPDPSAVATATPTPALPTVPTP